MQEEHFSALENQTNLYKHKCHSSISIHYCKTLLISKQIVNLDNYLSFSDNQSSVKSSPKVQEMAFQRL